MGVMDGMHNLISVYQRGWLWAALEAARNGADPAFVDALLDNSRVTARAIVLDELYQIHDEALGL